MKRSRIKPRRSTPRRREAPQEDGDWWADATFALLRRCADRCERCGGPLRGRLERHHRQRRRDGGDRVSNLLALHPECHSWVTTHPAEAIERGWIVPVEADPAAARVWLAGVGLRPGGWFLLDDGGGGR